MRLHIRDNHVEGDERPGAKPTQFWIVLIANNGEVVLAGEMLTRRGTAEDTCEAIIAEGVTYTP